MIRPAGAWIGSLRRLVPLAKSSTRSALVQDGPWTFILMRRRSFRPVARSLRQNGGLAVLSVVLAFGLWIFVTNAENPEQTRVVPVDLAVRPIIGETAMSEMLCR